MTDINLSKEDRKCYGKKGCGEIKQYTEFDIRSSSNGKRIYSSVCKECRRKNHKIHRDNNKEKIRQRDKRYQNERYKNDNSYNFVKVQRVRFYRVINSFTFGNINKINKDNLDIFGLYTTDQFHDYFDILLEDDMNYENYGNVWNWDHFLPIALFDLSDEKQLRICFHYTNYIPVYSIKNIKKGSSFDGVKYFYTRQPNIIADRDIVPKPLVEAIERGDKIDFWTYYGKLSEYQERLQLILD